MERLGPALFTAGMALLLIPLAEMMGAIGYMLIGMAFVIAGALLTFAPDVRGSRTGGVNRKNCPHCGAPNETDASTCSYCDRAVA